MNAASSLSSSSAARIKELADLSRDQLLTLWERHMGHAAPKTMSTALLFRAVAYDMQVKALGGLKSHELKALMHAAPPTAVLAHHGRLNAMVEDAAASAGSSDTPPKPHKRKVRLRSLLKPGTRLIRNWQGKAHVVYVYKEGFGWNGKIYRSLTVIAQEITGTHWSGPRFFRT